MTKSARSVTLSTFIAYLNKHRQRIVNYAYFQAEGISIGSGAIESTVKQIIGARIKLSVSSLSRGKLLAFLRRDTDTRFKHGEFIDKICCCLKFLGRYTALL